MEPLQDVINEIKKIYKRKTGETLSEEEALEGAHDLINFIRLICELEAKERLKKRWLKKEPEGFHLTDGTYNCRVCYRSVTGEESWYDDLGPKCLICQKAIKEGVIPSFVCKNHDSWYDTGQLKNKFGISTHWAKRLMRKGILKARIITRKKGVPYKYVFLKKENPDLIDPNRESPAEKSYRRHEENRAHKMIRTLPHKVHFKNMQQ